MTMTTPTELRALMDAHSDSFRKLRAITVEEMLAFFNAEIFDKYPTIQSLTWTQYSPYFNDGDPCVFSTNMYDDVCRGSLCPESSVDDDEWVIGCAPPESTEDVSTDVSEADSAGGCEVLNSVPDYLYESLFGDGYRVFVWRGGIGVTEYSHD